MLLLDQIRSTLASASKAEMRFASYVVDNPDVVYKSITEVMEESGASFGTVIRYCKKLGCSGFQDFKIRLATESSLIASSDQAISASGDGIPEARDFVEQIVTTARNTDPKTLDAVTDALLAAPQILVVGVAGSFPTAAELAYRLVRLGLRPTAEADEHMQAIRASGLGKRDVLVVVSFSGSTKCILETATVARKAGATVVAMTNYLRSPLAKMADHCLLTMLREQVLEAEIGSRLPFYYLIEVLTETLLARGGAAVAKALRKTSESVAGKQI